MSTAEKHRDTLLSAIMLVLDRWTYTDDREQVRQDCRVALDDAFTQVTNEMLALRASSGSTGAPDDQPTPEKKL